jgi:stage II sporulation protein D
LCQIGAAVMATKGYQAEDILKHYFHGAELKKLYD